MSRMPQTPRRQSTRLTPHLATPSTSRIHASPGNKSPSRRLASNFNALSIGVDTDANVDNFVVIELDQKNLKAGFPYQPEPAFDQSAEQLNVDLIWSFDALGDLDAQTTRFEVIFRRVFQSLLVNVKLQRVVVLVPTLYPSPLKKSIADALLQRLRCASLLFLPKPVCAALAAGCRAALVICQEHEETTVTPVYDLREMVPQTQTTIGLRDRTWLFHTDRDSDDDEQPLDRLVAKMLNHSLDTDTRGAVSQNIITIADSHRSVVDTKTQLKDRLDTLGMKSQYIDTLGPWVGGSLYVSSIGWYLVQEERARLPGECSKERYQSGERWLTD